MKDRTFSHNPFLSKLNRDTYTRRCFEIFAARQFMLSEYSDDLSTLFVEGGEAEYFRDRNELINKIRFYLKNDEKRLSIAQKGFEKVILGRHDVVSRMEYVTEIINKHITK